MWENRRLVGNFFFFLWIAMRLHISNRDAFLFCSFRLVVLLGQNGNEVVKEVCMGFLFSTHCNVGHYPILFAFSIFLRRCCIRATIKRNTEQKCRPR
jgi:hypothetical protein